MEQKFACVINCMDGRIQSSVIDYMRKEYGTLYVDTITVAGPSKILSEYKKDKLIQNIKFRTDISVNKHGSEVIAVVGHFDCAMIIMTDQEQQDHVLEAVKNVDAWHPNTSVIGLWVDEKLQVTRIV